MPSLFKFADEYKSYSDKFVILTFQHGNGKDTFAELDPIVEGFCSTKWNIPKFPFPIMLDSTGKTIAALGVRGFPTAILIDPNGRIFAKGHHGIEKTLGEQLKKGGK